MLIAFTLALPPAYAQWQILDAHTTADLSSVDTVGSGVAWVSGSGGTILRTVDGGRAWQHCAVPRGGDQLDFRGIQAFSASTAVLMAGGKGELSRLYKTTDGCQTWKEVFDNPNASGSFVALRRTSAFQIYLLGDPVNGKFTIFESPDAGSTWALSANPGLDVPQGGNVFASGSTELVNVGFLMAFGTAGKQASVYTLSPVCGNTTGRCALTWNGRATPLTQAGTTAGVFSLAGRTVMVRSNATITGIGTMPSTTLIAVGGDSSAPARNIGSAAFSEDEGATWKPSANPPGGFRSAIAFDAVRDRFIAVGPTGTDISIDDGNDWFALKPGLADDSDADRNWTALSLPFVVGPHGRVGLLDVEVSPTFKAQSAR